MEIVRVVLGRFIKGTHDWWKEKANGEMGDGEGGHGFVFGCIGGYCLGKWCGGWVFKFVAVGE